MTPARPALRHRPGAFVGGGVLVLFYFVLVASSIAAFIENEAGIAVLDALLLTVVGVVGGGLWTGLGYAVLVAAARPAAARDFVRAAAIVWGVGVLLLGVTCFGGGTF